MFSIQEEHTVSQNALLKRLEFFMALQIPRHLCSSYLRTINTIKSIVLFVFK